jgi:hypothetical protein
MINTRCRIATATILCLFGWTPIWAQTSESVARAGNVRRHVLQLPIGATITLRTHQGERLKAVLLIVDDATIVVKPATRIPEPSRRLSFDSIEAIERYEDHVRFGKYTGVGGGIGAAVFLMLLAGG